MSKYTIYYELTATIELESKSDSPEDIDAMMSDAFDMVYDIPGVEVDIRDVLVEEVNE